MKCAVIFVICVTLASAAVAACVEVQAGPQNSSGHLRVAISLQGQPVKGVKVDFYAHGTTPVLFEAVSDDGGIVVPPKLRPGDYDVVAALDEEIRNFLWLRVVREGGTKTLSIDLTGDYESAHPELQMKTMAAFELPVRDRIQAFEGVVLDPSGATVPGTKIVIIKMGVPAKDFILPLRTGPNGHFQAHYPKAVTLASFFRTDSATQRSHLRLQRMVPEICRSFCRSGCVRFPSFDGARIQARRKCATELLRTANDKRPTTGFKCPNALTSRKS